MRVLQPEEEDGRIGKRAQKRAGGLHGAHSASGGRMRASYALFGDGG